MDGKTRFIKVRNKLINLERVTAIEISEEFIWIYFDCDKSDVIKKHEYGESFDRLKFYLENWLHKKEV